MYQKNQQSKYFNDISNKLKQVVQITFSLKRFVYKLANFPIETLKHKSSASNGNVSTLTTIDSIFFDLKKVQTILMMHSQTLNFCHNQTQEQQTFVHRINPLKKTSFSPLNSENYGLQSDKSFKNLYKRRKTSINNKFPYEVMQQRFEPKQLSCYTQKTDQFYTNINHTFFITPHRNRKRSHQIGISKVSSHQQSDFSQYPTIKIVRESRNQYLPNERPSLLHQKSTVDFHKIDLQELRKQKQNEAFLRQISKSRDSVLKSIQKKKQKCINTIKKMNQSLIQKSHLFRKDKSEERLRKKSKTQKFDILCSKKQNQKERKEYQINPSEQFVGI